MRAPFGYESNVVLISQWLVPDHLSNGEWMNLLEGWTTSGGSRTLLEYLASEWKNENELLAILGESADVKVCRDPTYMDERDLDAIGSMLASHGFRVIESEAAKQMLTGGDTIKPDLVRYLGEAAKDWQWVLVPPCRDPAPYRKPFSADSSPSNDAGMAAWLSQTINGLWAMGETDIHLETYDGILTIRTNKGKQMRKIGEWTDGRAGAVTRLLCRWAGTPDWDGQSFLDGTLQLPKGVSSRLRFSLIPTINGSSTVLRAPAPALYARRLSRLGLPPELIGLILDRNHHDYGLILCTGSTGSGKKTTIYGNLKELEHDNLKILTIEDPVEQEIPHAVQSSVDLRNGWTFERAVQAYLRQDPDIILIGEIRDAASATAACRAALTGHCVLSTMHASSTDAALERLAAWGLPQGVLAESVTLVINQQLCRNRRDNPSVVKFYWNTDCGEAVAWRK